MRNFLVALAAAALVALMPLATTPAQAVPLPAASGIKGAIDAIDVTESVACWRAWRCGYRGCGWRLVCTPRYYGVYRPYPLYRPYWGYRSYRPYWGYRTWGYRRYW